LRPLNDLPADARWNLASGRHGPSRSGKRADAELVHEPANRGRAQAGELRQVLQSPRGALFSLVQQRAQTSPLLLGQATGPAPAQQAMKLTRFRLGSGGANAPEEVRFHQALHGELFESQSCTRGLATKTRFHLRLQI